MNEEDKRDLAVIGFIFVAGVIIYCLLQEIGLSDKIVNSRGIVIDKSLYKCKMLNTLKVDGE